MSRTLIDLHILHPVPPSCINRDDLGSPKTAIFGGVNRHRVSSQSWKAAMRKDFNALGRDDLRGLRSTRLPAHIADIVAELNPDIDAAESVAAALSLIGYKPKDGVLSALGFMSRDQMKAVAQYVGEHHEQLCSGANTPEHKKALSALARERTSLDMALFGRMVAADPESSIDAACQVAHAMGVGRVAVEHDFYVAMDDLADASSSGGAMMGSIEFTSSTLYRYACLDVDALKVSLGDPQPAVLAAAVRSFIDAFVTSMPGGRSNSFANQTLPSTVRVVVRDTRPFSFVGAFEKPVQPGDDQSVTEMAAAAMDAYADKLMAMYGDVALADLTSSIESGISLSCILDQTQALVASRS